MVDSEGAKAQVCRRFWRERVPLGKTAQKQGDRVQMGSLNDMALRKLAELEAGNLRRRLKETDRKAGAYVERSGRTLISFCCNDYLNLAHDPRVIKAAKSALDEWGASAGASRLVTGNHSIFTELERRLAQLKQTDDCLVFGSGYLANLGIIPTLMTLPLSGEENPCQSAPPFT